MGSNSKKSISKKKIYIIDILILAIIVFLDQITKYLAILYLKGHPARSIINGILEFRYLENSGAAFGLLKNQQSFFVMVSVILFLAILYVVIKASPKKRFLPLNICVIIIAGGSAGNLIDRIRFNYVVDFIYFSVINFPVFNLADLFLTVAAIILIFLLLFYYREDDFNFLKFKEKKLREIE